MDLGPFSFNFALFFLLYVLDISSYIHYLLITRRVSWLSRAARSDC